MTDKITGFFDRFYVFLLQSSANPKASSLAVQAALTALVTYATMAAGFGHIQLPTDLLTQLVDGIVTGTQYTLMTVSIIAGVWGTVRKIFAFFAGTHASLNATK